MSESNLSFSEIQELRGLKNLLKSYGLTTKDVEDMISKKEESKKEDQDKDPNKKEDTTSKSKQN